MVGHTALWAFMYEPELPRDIDEAREILEKYSKIPKEQIDQHLHAVVWLPFPLGTRAEPANRQSQRDKAWEVVRYPCVGRWRFLYLRSPQDGCFQHVLSRLQDAKSGDALLDLGCCMGQALRQFAYRGVDVKRLYGSDLHQEFIDLGFELFRDRDTFSTQFYAGDVLNPSDKALRKLNGRVTIVHAQSFFHLFDRPQQLIVAQRIVGFLKSKASNTLVYGRHIGSITPGEMRTSRRTWYLHDQASFQELWDEVGRKTRTRWVVEAVHIGPLPIDIPGVGKDARVTQYAVHRAA